MSHQSREEKDAGVQVATKEADQHTMVSERAVGSPKDELGNEEALKISDIADDITEEEFERVKRKVDRILLPLMWWMYGIQQSDKTGLGTMNLFGLQKDTGMHGRQYSLLTVLFCMYAGGTVLTRDVAYAIFEFPSNYIMQRLNIGRTLSTYMFLWGIVVFVQGFFTNWSEFAAFRFLQGALECTISPGFQLIIARWYTTREHSSRSLVFQSANAGWGIVVDLTYYGIAKAANRNPGGFAAWRGIEVFLGGQTFLASILAFLLLGTPGEVRWLTPREREVVQARVLRNHAGTDKTGTKTWKWKQMRDAFKDPVLYFQFCVTFLVCIVNGAITTFGTVLAQSFGFDEYQVVLYDCPRNAFSVAWFILVGYTSTKYLGIRMWWMMLSTTIVFVAMLIIALLPIEDQYRWAKMVMYWLTSIFVIPSFSAWALISSNTAGRTKMSVVSATVFIAYCTGNIAGSQVMKPSDAPHYTPGVITMAVVMAVVVLLIYAWRCWLVYQNKRKARIVEEMGLSPQEAERKGQQLGAEDLTDLENPFFRYSL